MGLRARWRNSTGFQDAGTAAATFVIGLVTGLAGLTGIWSDIGLVEAPVWWHHVLLAIGCLAMLVKRRHPAAALGAGTVVATADTLLGGSVGIVLVLFDLLYAVGLFASSRVRTTVTTAVFVVIGTASVVGGLAAGEFRIAAFLALQLVALLFVPLWWAANLRQQGRIGLLDAERTAREAVVAERAAMARDLHDVIASHLSATAIHSGAALARLPDTDRDREALRQVRTSSLAALDEMRSMIVLLRSDSDALDPALPGGLDDLVDAAAASGLRISAHTPEIPGMPVVVAQTVHRIVREALTNAGKHAPGSVVVLDVRAGGGAGGGAGGDLVTVLVSNTLTRAEAFDHRALSAGTGLVSLRERAALLGGSLTAERQGERFLVRAELPSRSGS